MTAIEYIPAIKKNSITFVSFQSQSYGCTWKVFSPTGSDDSEIILCARLKSDSESGACFSISPVGTMEGVNTIISNAIYDSVVKYNSAGGTQNMHHL